MSYPELSDEERAFLEEQLAGRDDVNLHEDDDGKVLVEKVRPVKERRRSIFGSMYFWIGVVLTIPVIIVGFMAFIIGRISLMFGGTQVLDAIAKEGMTETAQQTLNDVGLTWFPQFLELYEMRWLLGAGVFTVFIVIAGIMLAIELYRTRSKE